MTGDLRKELAEGLAVRGLAWNTHYASVRNIRSVRIPLGDKTKAGVLIKQVPENHRMLRALCDVAQTLKVKLHYQGESAASLGNSLIQEILVRRRKCADEDTTRELLETQRGCCALCGDKLRSWELDHIRPVVEGGSSEITNMRPLRKSCHAGETQRLQLKGQRPMQHFESQFGPEMMEVFKTTPKPPQIYKGHKDIIEEAENKARELYYDG